MQHNLDDDLAFLQRTNVNIDITHRCPLECERCQRFTSFTAHGLKVPGKDISIENFQKVLNHFHHINFCGQVSDPVHHPKFIEILSMIHDQEKSCSVHHASAAKPAAEVPPESRLKSVDPSPTIAISSRMGLRRLMIHLLQSLVCERPEMARHNARPNRV